MDEWAGHRSVNPGWEPIRTLGLEKNLLDLEVYGLTVIRPEQIAAHVPEHLARLRQAVLGTCTKRSGGLQEFSLSTNEIREDAAKAIFNTEKLGPPRAFAASPKAPPNQMVLYDMICEDQIFEEIIQCPLTLSLIEYYLTKECQLSSLTGFVKAQGDSYGPSLGLHQDSGLATMSGQPLPSVQHPHVFNTNWILTDYTKENGAFCIVPGSHRWQRRLEAAESSKFTKQCVPVEAEAGSVLVFHGNCWHGAFPKETAGLRLSVNAYYMQNYFKAQERFVEKVSQEMLERNGPRFASLLGFEDVWHFEDRRGPLPFRLRGEKTTEKVGPAASAATARL